MEEIHSLSAGIRYSLDTNKSKPQNVSSSTHARMLAQCRCSAYYNYSVRAHAQNGVSESEMA